MDKKTKALMAFSAACLLVAAAFAMQNRFLEVENKSLIRSTLELANVTAEFDALSAKALVFDKMNFAVIESYNQRVCTSYENAAYGNLTHVRFKHSDDTKNEVMLAWVLECYSANGNILSALVFRYPPAEPVNETSPEFVGYWDDVLPYVEVGDA